MVSIGFSLRKVELLFIDSKITKRLMLIPSKKLNNIITPEPYDHYESDQHH